MRKIHALAVAAMLIGGAAFAQSVTLPPDGGNQHAKVTQSLGLVDVTIDYHSPKVHNPRNGEDRRGKIWGQLVPYGTAKGLGYGTCTECPWRAGANENTVFTVNHDVQIEGQPLPAGSYGLHMIPGENEWTIVFSKNSTSWGSFFYDPSEDALRVKVKPVKSEYHEYLTYEFPDRQLDRATAELRWEDLAVPFTITVPNANELYLANLRNELRGGAGGSWENLAAGARWALQNKVGLKDALGWAQRADNPNFGWENYQTISVLADAQEANGMTDEAKKTRERAMNHSSATAVDLHQYARQLLRDGKKQEALAVWQTSAKRFGQQWPVNVGLARGNSAVGNYKEALKYAKLALAQAPDEQNRKVLEAGIAKLEAGKDMNQ
jgi:hypothetical protein